MRITRQIKALYSYRIIFPILFVCSFFWPPCALPWISNTHYDMVNDTRDFFPDQMHSDLSYAVYDILEPDKNRVVRHTNVAACANMINILAKKSIKILQQQKNTEAAFAAMGRGTHYVQDLNCPHHGIGRYVQGAHESFEHKVFGSFWNHSDFDGFHYIIDYRQFAYNAARFSKRYIRYCDRLNHDHGSTYLEKYNKLIDPLYDHTVNDSIDYWLSILWDGLGEEKYSELGLPPKVGIRADEKKKFPKVKSLWD